MSQDETLYVRLPPELAGRVKELRDKAQQAQRRANKLPAGDRTEILRMDAISSAIDQLAVAAIWGGAPCVTGASPPQSNFGLLDGAPPPREVPRDVQKWLAAGGLVAHMTLPHGYGAAPTIGAEGAGPPRPASAWRSTAQATKEAVRERFEHRLAMALSDPSSPEAALYPSGIANPILTEGVRNIVDASGGERASTLPVRYRDGSEAPPFPIRLFDMSDQVPAGVRVLRFSLMSVRHVELDTIVDGAWLRNSKISQPRPLGMTDGIAFETSREQLLALDPRIPTHLYLYQTGFEPAILGFYRALALHLRDHPKSISVTPRYYRGEEKFDEGRPWSRG